MLTATISSSFQTAEMGSIVKSQGKRQIMQIKWPLAAGAGCHAVWRSDKPPAAQQSCHVRHFRIGGDYANQSGLGKSKCDMVCAHPPDVSVSFPMHKFFSLLKETLYVLVGYETRARLQVS